MSSIYVNEPVTSGKAIIKTSHGEIGKLHYSIEMKNYLLKYNYFILFSFINLHFIFQRLSSGAKNVLSLVEIFYNLVLKIIMKQLNFKF